MHSTLALAVASSVALFGTVHGHMKMITPMPYGSQTLDNSPLAADGSDFPCKQRSGVYDLDGAQNNIVIGEPQTLSFEGSAVHGGGSCQVSLTTDQQPTTNSQWMVIQSIQGNCPSNVTGNLPDDASGTGAAVFQYTVPQGIAPGQYTIAWSWVNKIGNREFYMNCGPATITAASKKRYAPEPKVRRQSSFPPLFVANLVGVDNGCITVETEDTVYPEPGDAVQNGTIGVNLQLPQSCSGLAAVATAATPSAGAATTAGASSSVTTSAAGSSVVESTTSAASDGVPTSSAATSSPAAAGAGAGATTETVSPIPAQSTSSAPSATSAAPGATSSSTTPTTTGAQSGPCSDEGDWYCSSDGASFQRCASGQWSAAIDMPAGETCTPGLSDTLNLATSKRSNTGFHARRSRLMAFGRV